MSYRTVDLMPMPVSPPPVDPVRERRVQTIVGVVVVAVVIVLFGLAAWAMVGHHQRTQAAREAVSPAAVAKRKTALADVGVKPMGLDADGAVVISRGGVGVGYAAGNIPTVTFYTEPLCPGCAAVHQALDPTFEKLVLAGQINLKVVPLTFQDDKSSDRYSTRAMDGFLQFIQKDTDPRHALGYLSNIYAEDFQPGELDDYKPVSGLRLAEQAVAAGVDHEIAAESFAVPRDQIAQLGVDPNAEPYWDNTVKRHTLKYADYLKADDDYNTSRPELSASGVEGFSTPTLTINGHYWSVSDADKSVLGLKDGFLHAIGLREDQAGATDPNDGEPLALPSIGSDHKPLPLTASVDK